MRKEITEQTVLLKLKEVTEQTVLLEWKEAAEPGAKLRYELYWANKNTPGMKYKKIYEGEETSYECRMSTHRPHYFKLRVLRPDGSVLESEVLKTPTGRVLHEQLEHLNRGLIAIKTEQGIFLGWRLLREEATGYSKNGLTGSDFAVYRDGVRIAEVMDSTNYLDPDGMEQSSYQVAVIGKEAQTMCAPVKAFASGKNYIDIPIQQPEDGVTPAGEHFAYHANDMSVGDVDGDGEYEYIVKWDPENARDVSQKGYTGRCILDCYKLDGRLLWRLDMGPNIRAGAHYTQFMVYDFDGDGKAEMSVKTAPGTCMTQYIYEQSAQGEYRLKETKAHYVTLTARARAAGAQHTDNYVCDARGYRKHLVELFRSWQEQPEVERGEWPATLEECFGIPVRFCYPLSEEAAEWLVDYFILEYAPSRSAKNELDKFEGFIYEGAELLTMFAGDGSELETIDFPFERVDDGLRWGDYAMNRIEPCNRVDRFLSGVAYLDGEHPSLIVCRGYYTRATITAYDFKDGHHVERFRVDSGFVPMNNPFCDNPHAGAGTDPVYGLLAGQGNHSLSTADVDGDGCQEIIYGAAVIDHDGSLLYSSYGKMPDGTMTKFGHGDAIHVADIDPDRPGYEIFHVFEGASAAPYGFALCDAATGEVIFGEPADRDLGRCMIGDIAPEVHGLQCYVNDVYDCKGNRIAVAPLGTNMSVRFAADMSTQIIDGVDYVHGKHTGIVNDHTHGVMLVPENVCVNNGTKGNPCLVADIFGDFREEILYRKADDSGIRIYTATEITKHKLFTLMHDTMYRTGVAWQNNCYNQPCYTKFYLASDMDWEYVLF